MASTRFSNSSVFLNDTCVLTDHALQDSLNVAANGALNIGLHILLELDEIIGETAAFGTMVYPKAWVNPKLTKAPRRVHNTCDTFNHFTSVSHVLMPSATNLIFWEQDARASSLRHILLWP